MMREVFPSTQNEHFVLPRAVVDFPAGHTLQDAELVEYWPNWHGLHFPI
jgi:hypothetical protein